MNKFFNKIIFFQKIKIILFAVFVGSGLKDIFRRRAHYFIFSRPIFRFLAVFLTPLTTENRDVPSANSLGNH